MKAVHGKILILLTILCMAENLSIDEQDCGLDFFDSIDRRYPHRLKEERKKTVQQWRDCDLLSLD